MGYFGTCLSCELLDAGMLCWSKSRGLGTSARVVFDGSEAPEEIKAQSRGIARTSSFSGETLSTAVVMPPLLNVDHFPDFLSVSLSYISRMVMPAWQMPARRGTLPSQDNFLFGAKISHQPSRRRRLVS
jgi:hypothetical protein